MTTHKKTKKFTIKRWVEYGCIALFIGLLFTTDLKAEVFGFVQRGILELGFFTPTIEQIDQTDSKVNNAQTAHLSDYNAHHLELMDQNGNTLNVADLEGKVVFINFWATWCPPCIAEMPGINNLYLDYADDKEVVFLLISRDRSFSKARSFNQEKGFAFNIYTAKSAIPQEFRARGIPNTYILNKNGKIVFNHLGLGNYDTEKFRNFIDKLKAE